MDETSDSDVTALTNVNENYTILNTVYNESPAAKLMKIRKYQLHAKTYSPKWEKDPNYSGWVQRSKKGDGFYYCLACNQDYTCGKSELDKHASSRKHCMNLINMPEANNETYSVYEMQDMNNSDTFDHETSIVNQDFGASSTSFSYKFQQQESKEESFGKYIISELKRIKKKKTYELVKWEILQALQKAMLKEAETEDSED